jgi:hypothetical protein
MTGPNATARSLAAGAVCRHRPFVAIFMQRVRTQKLLVSETMSLGDLIAMPVNSLESWPSSDVSMRPVPFII